MGTERFHAVIPHLPQERRSIACNHFIGQQRNAKQSRNCYSEWRKGVEPLQKVLLWNGLVALWMKSRRSEENMYQSLASTMPG